VGQSSFVLADIPGLIEGAHEGHGLGTRFLGHVERCAVLIHMIDATGGDPADAYKVIRAELKAYSPELAKKQEIITFNKIDALDEKSLSKIVKTFVTKTKKTPRLISAAASKNVTELMQDVFKITEKARKAARAADPDGVTTTDWQP
jgi:GTP-binding protein